MRICIFGLGAVGGHLAARLAAGGHEVSAVARGEVLAALGRGPLTLRSGDETVRGQVKASAAPEALGPQDVVLSTLKANALPALAEGVAPLLEPQTLVVFAQNGAPWWYGQGIGAGRPKPPPLPRLDPGGDERCAQRLDARVRPVVGRADDQRVAPRAVVRNDAGRDHLVRGMDHRADDALGLNRAGQRAARIEPRRRRRLRPRADALSIPPGKAVLREDDERPRP